MIKIIPAIDIIAGQCVRLKGGDYAQTTVYSADPVALAQEFEQAGITHIHLVDLDGARIGEVQNWAVLEGIATRTRLTIDFSGGIRSTEIAEMAFQRGATQITIGSLAVRDPNLFSEWLDRFGPTKIMLAADVRNGIIQIAGWLETTDQALLPFLARQVEMGIARMLCTDVSKDGMLTGPAFSLYSLIRVAHPELQLIASGGISRLGDITRLDEMGLYGVIIGTALYEGKLTLPMLKAYINPIK